MRRFMHSTPTAKYVPEFEPLPEDPGARSWLIVYGILCEGGTQRTNVSAAHIIFLHWILRAALFGGHREITQDDLTGWQRHRDPLIAFRRRDIKLRIDLVLNFDDQPRRAAHIGFKELAEVSRVMREILIVRAFALQLVDLLKVV